MALRNGRRYFGYWPDDSLTDADTARRHAEVFLDALHGEGFAQTNLRPLFCKRCFQATALSGCEAT